MRSPDLPEKESDYLYSTVSESVRSGLLSPQYAQYEFPPDNLFEPQRDRRGGEIGSGYNWLDDDEENGPEFEWIEISDLGRRLEARDDWNSGPLNLGWSFEFYDEEYTSIRVCSNGWASFTNNSRAYSPFELPSEREPYNILAVQWVDLNPDSIGSIYFWTDPDEEVAVVSWLGIPVWGGGEDSEQTFQLIIRGDGIIIYQYADDHPTERLTSIGIQNSDGSSGLNISYSRDDGGNPGRAYGIGSPWIEYPNGAGIFPNVLAVDFGEVFIEEVETETLELTNHGGENLEIDSITVDNDVFAVIGVDDTIVLESSESWSFEIAFAPDDAGRFDGSINIYNNAENADDGRIEIHLTGIGVGGTEISVEPLEINRELYTGESSQNQIIISNVGGGILSFDTDLTVISYPYQGVYWNQEIETRYALFAETDPWEFDLENIFRTIENLDYVRYRNADDFDNVDLNDYDAVWIGNNQSNNWISSYNNNLERFEEFVDGGGIYYMCTATENQGVTPVHPGGLIPRSNYFENWGVTELSDEENYLFGFMEWEEGTRLRGRPVCLTGYNENSLEAIENTDSYEILVRGDARGVPIVATYNYGQGSCIVSGTVDGFLHLDPELFLWGRTGEGMLRYMDFLNILSDWISWSPSSGTVEVDEDATVTVILEAADHYVEGDYSAEIHILSNDMNNPDITVDVTLQISGVPDIDFVWAEDNGYPEMLDWNTSYNNLINNDEYEMIATLINRGNSVLQIDGIDIDDGNFTIELDSLTVNPRQEIPFLITCSPEESGFHEATMNVLSDDPDEEQYVVNLVATSVEPPEIVIDPEEIEIELYEGGRSTHELTISNAGEASLRFRINYDVLETPDRDSGNRALRNTNGNRIPDRDAPPGRYAAFQNRETWGWLRDYMLGAVEGLNYDSFTDEDNIGRVDLHQYRAVVLAGNQQTNSFHEACAENLAWFEEYVNDGGTMYIESGGREEFTFEAPGGITWEPNLERYGSIALNQEDNYLLELTGWDEGKRLSGMYFLYSYYPEEQFRQLENSDWYQVIAVGLSTGNPGIIAYNYGKGAVLVAGCPVGYQWRWNNNAGEWGSIQEEILTYLSNLSNSAWFDSQPRSGEVADDEDVTIVIDIDIEREVTGRYEAELIINSNDPGRPTLRIPITLDVVGAPDINMIWSENAGYPGEFNWNAEFGNLFVDNEYELTVQLCNFGSDELEITDITIDDEYFSTELNQSVIEADETVEMMISLEVPADAPGDHSTRMVISSNDPDEEEFEINMSATVYLQPIINITPSEVEEELFTGQRVERVIEFENQGDVTLIFEAWVDMYEDQRRDNIARDLRSTRRKGCPRRDAEVEVLNSFNWDRAPGNSYKAGIAWDYINRRMWISTYPSRWIGAVDPFEDYAEVAAWQTGEQNAMGMAWIGGVLYTVAWQSEVLGMWDTDGNNLGTLNLSFQPTALTGIPRDDLLLVIDNDDLDRILIYNIDGERIGDISDYRQLIENGTSRSICWVSDHPQGLLWLNTPGHLWQLAVNTDDWEAISLVQDMEWDGTQEWDGVGHDGYNLYLGGWNLDEYLIVEDNINEPHWLAVDPLSGEIEADGTLDVTLILSAEGLFGGDYAGIVYFVFNDREYPDAVVSVTLHVEERSLIETSPVAHPFQEAPETLVFEPTSIGEEFEDRLPVTIRNPGSVDLEIERIELSNEDEFDIDINEDEYIIEPMQEIEIDLMFQPLQLGERSGEIHIYSNAENDELEDGYIWWVLNGTGLLPPAEREVELSAGWNVISLNINPPVEMYREDENRGPDVILMMQQLRVDENLHHVIIMKDERGDFYLPSYNFNSIDYWNLAEGYKVMVDETVTANWSGIPLPAQGDITLEEGWNMISYFPAYELDASAPDFYVLSSIIDNVIVAKDGDGNFMAPTYNYSNMPPWRQTRGYQIFVDNDLSFNYPAEADRGEMVIIPGVRTAEKTRWKYARKTGHNMSLLVISIDGLEMTEGGQVAAFSPYEMLVGVGNITDNGCGLAVWGNDSYTDVVDGLLKDETFELRLWDRQRDLELELSVTSLDFGPGLIYEDEGFTVLEATVSKNLPTDYYLKQNYPNPFNSTTQISYGSPVKTWIFIRIYDLQGREVTTLVDSEQPAGHHTVVWIGDNYPSGLYLVNMKATGFNTVRKITLVK